MFGDIFRNWGRVGVWLRLFSFRVDVSVGVTASVGVRVVLRFGWCYVYDYGQVWV